MPPTMPDAKYSEENRQPPRRYMAVGPKEYKPSILNAR
jgi:hypothetical protein